MNEQHKSTGADYALCAGAGWATSCGIDAALPDTTRGRDAAVMVRNGTFTGLSIEFRAEAEGRASGVRMIRKGYLGGAALVDSGLACDVGRGPGQDARTPGAPMPVTLTSRAFRGA